MVWAFQEKPGEAGVDEHPFRGTKKAARIAPKRPYWMAARLTCVLP
jgi:hypothetical protein